MYVFYHLSFFLITIKTRSFGFTVWKHIPMEHTCFAFHQIINDWMKFPIALDFICTDVTNFYSISFHYILYIQGRSKVERNRTINIRKKNLNSSTDFENFQTKFYTKDLKLVKIDTNSLASLSRPFSSWIFFYSRPVQYFGNFHRISSSIMHTIDNP